MEVLLPTSSVVMVPQFLYSVPDTSENPRFSVPISVPKQNMLIKTRYLY